MRHSEFWTLLDQEFGAGYAGTLARTHHVNALADRTVHEALEAGVAPKVIWAALCEDFEVPPQRRFGRERPRHP